MKYQRFALVNRSIGLIPCGDKESRRDIIRRIHNSLHGEFSGTPTVIHHFTRLPVKSNK